MRSVLGSGAKEGDRCHDRWETLLVDNSMLVEAENGDSDLAVSLLLFIIVIRL